MSLPIESHEKQLEEKSVVLLQTLLLNEFENKYKFKFSKGTDYDYGVDCNLELRINREMTDFNCHVQVKAIDKLEKKAKNGDGSFSIQIKTSNVNYLMNTPKSIYILYVNSENVFYYEWADEFFLKLRKEDKNWRSKKALKTLRFHKKVDDNALLYIFNEVWKRAKAGREISEKLAHFRDLINPKSPNVIISADNFNVKSEHNTIEFIEKYGGYYLNKREDFFLVKESDRITTEYLVKSPLACLILGIANFQVGHTYKALDLIVKAKSKADLLDKRYQSTLKYYEVNIKHLIGKIDNAQLDEKLNQIEYEPHKLQLEHLKILKEFREYKELTEKRLLPVRNFAKKMEKFSEKYPYIYLQSRIELLRVEGWYTNVYYGNPDNDKEKILEMFKNWEALLGDIMKEVESSKDEFLKANLYYTIVYVMTTYRVIKIKIELIKITNQNILKQYDQLINEGINTFKRYNCNWQLCILLVSKFNLYKLFNKESEANEIFQELSQIADVYDFPELVEEAKKNEKHIVEANKKALVANDHD